MDCLLFLVGLVEVEVVGCWFKDNNLLLDCVLCLLVCCICEIFEVVLGVIGFVEKWLEDVVYDVILGILVGLIDDCCEVDWLFVVGYNFGLECLVVLMSEGSISDYCGMLLVGIVVFVFDCEVFIELGVVCLIVFWWL